MKIEKDQNEHNNMCLMTYNNPCKFTRLNNVNNSSHTHTEVMPKN